MAPVEKRSREGTPTCPPATCCREAEHVWEIWEDSPGEWLMCDEHEARRIHFCPNCGSSTFVRDVLSVGDRVVAMIKGQEFQGSVHWQDGTDWFFIPEGGRVMHGFKIAAGALRRAPR